MDSWPYPKDDKLWTSCGGGLLLGTAALGSATMMSDSELNAVNLYWVWHRPVNIGGNGGQGPAEMPGAG